MLDLTPTSTDFWFLPLGGCGEIGMNLNLYGHNNQWLMIDCGVSFEQQRSPENTLKNNTTICADPSFIANRRSQLAGLIISHAHEDHIGAVPYLWPELQCPIYTTPFTADVLFRKLREFELIHEVPVHVVEPKSRVSIGHFDVEWISLTHSIPEPQALIIRTKAGKVFHTADWKLDPAPIVGQHFQKNDFQKLAAEKMTSIVCDSTNATTPGWSISEGDAAKGLFDVISNAKGRVIVTCFGSNVARMKTIVEIAKKTNRYAGLLGRSLHNMVRSAKNTGYWSDDTDLISSSHLGYLPANEVLAIATGSQGDPNTALYRLSQRSHPDLDLDSGDTIVFSSRTIPGNEPQVERLVNKFREMGVNVIEATASNTPIHASGHPCEEELAMMYDWVKPASVVPVHGEERHMLANAEIARQSGVPSQLVGKNGDLFQLSPKFNIRRNFAKTGRITLQSKEE